MYKHLYTIFARWYLGGSIYFYGDPHFGDLESYILRGFIIKNKDGTYSKTSSPNVKENLSSIMKTIKNELDQMQIDNINKVCGKNDTLVILGDVGDIDCVRKLKAGHKVLIMGNHDKGASNYKRYVDFYDGEGDNHLFDEVYEGTLQISPKIILSHEPVDYPYCLNIHGHVHQVNPFGAYTEGVINPRYNCVAEQINYKPVCINTFIDSGILKNIPDIHRKTIEERKKQHDKKKKIYSSCKRNNIFKWRL